MRRNHQFENLKKYANIMKVVKITFKRVKQEFQMKWALARNVQTPTNRVKLHILLLSLRGGGSTARRKNI